jgi:hypothetical protein
MGARSRSIAISGVSARIGSEAAFYRSLASHRTRGGGENAPAETCESWCSELTHLWSAELSRPGYRG